jgi:hypothetical protein
MKTGNRKSASNYDSINKPIHSSLERIRSILGLTNAVACQTEQCDSLAAVSSHFQETAANQIEFERRKNEARTYTGVAAVR